MELIELTKKALDMRLDIYFSLTLKQQQEFNNNYQWQNIEHVLVEDFKKITKSKRLIRHQIKLKDLTNKILIREIS